MIQNSPECWINLIINSDNESPENMTKYEIREDGNKSKLY